MARPMQKPPVGAKQTSNLATPREVGQPAEVGAVPAQASRAASAEDMDKAEPKRDAASMELAEIQDEAFESLRESWDKRSDDGNAPDAIAAEFAGLWLPLLVADREVLAPALRKARVSDTKSAAARVRKDLVNFLLAELLDDNRAQSHASAQLEALADAFDRYERAARRERDELNDEDFAIGRQMKARLERARPRFADLTDDPGAAIAMLAPDSLSRFSNRQRSGKEFEMARNSSNTPDRDDRGRFMSDDDDRGSRGRGGDRDRDDDGRFAGSSRGRSDERESRSGRGGERDEDGRFASSRSARRYDEDDRHSRMSRARSDERERDEDGRFASNRSGRRDDEDDRGSRGGRGRSDDHDRDEDGRFVSSRGSGGRYADDDRGSRGRSGGDRERDEDGRFASGERGGRSRSDDEYSRSQPSRSRDDDDRRSGGWFGDSDRRSEASRRGWRTSDHGDSGWYGDSEGHSEAARRGWESGHRSQRRDDEDDRRSSRSSNDDDRRSSARGRDDDDRRSSRRDEDDDRRGSSGRGHGGWSGDPEGHAEAARRGWEHRR
jgi:hypothetical protein